MVGGRITCYPISAEEASKIRKRQRFVNKGTLYAAGAAALTLAAESVYRNLGGNPEIANYIFQVGGYTFLGNGIIALMNNQYFVTGPEESEQKEKGLEQKVSNS